jgi:hypothetical protein
MLASIPLTDDERAAMSDDSSALDRLIERLADVPTPAGPTPRQLGLAPNAKLLPVVGQPACPAVLTAADST